jgi:hypothetical protein
MARRPAVAGEPRLLFGLWPAGTVACLSFGVAETMLAIRVMAFWGALFSVT